MTMYCLLENQTKDWLARQGFPVPEGSVACSAEQARSIARQFPCGAAVKALIPTGRRGKAGAVRLARSPDDAHAAAVSILGQEIAGFPTASVYVEELVDIEAEYFLSFSMSQDGIHVLISAAGGIEVETLFETRPDALLREHIDPVQGLPVWQAVDLWCRCGLKDKARLAGLAALTSRLYDAFRRADAITLEINPLAVDRNGALGLVGAMMAIDEAALFRHPEWRDASRTQAVVANERERLVQQANAALPGGEAQYVELDGDIGLFVGGGGAGLYIHDLIVELGGRPANHCVTPPTGSDIRKIKAVLTAIVGNPAARCLLVGFNFAQMARADLRLQALAEVLKEQSVDTRNFPIVIRLFGAGENEARKIAQQFPGMEYMPRGSSLREAAAEIVRISHEFRKRVPA